MTTIQQALHIFRKDVRHLRFEIAAVFLLLTVLILSGIQTWEGLQEGGQLTPDSAGPLTVLLVITWGLLIARVIQTEALPGDRHFWLTRPYSRAGLIISKMLFIVTFINLPLLFAQAAIVSLDGIPLYSNLDGLFLNQVVLSVLLLLPVAAIASLTRNLAQFLPAVVIVGGLLAGPVLDRRTYGDLEWIRSLLGGILGVSIAAFILWRQYRLRRSVHTALFGTAAATVGIILYLAFPQPAAFAIESTLMGSPESSFALSVGQLEGRGEETAPPNRYRQLLAFPLAVSGADPMDLRIESSQLTFRTLSGVRRRSRARVAPEGQNLMHVTSLDRNFFEAAKNSPVDLEAELYVTQYGNGRSTEVPLDGTPVYISGPGQCGVVVSYNSRRFVCRSAFQSPQPFSSDRVVPWEGYDPLRDMSSTFRAEALVYPIIARSYRLVGEDSNELAPAEPVPPTVLLVRDPIAYFRYTMKAANVHLRDFAINDPQVR